MQLNKKNIKKIFKKYKNSFQEMEHYDRTREILWARKRIDFYILTLKRFRNLLFRFRFYNFIQ